MRITFHLPNMHLLWLHWFMKINHLKIPIFFHKSNKNGQNNQNKNLFNTCSLCIVMIRLDCHQRAAVSINEWNKTNHQNWNVKSTVSLMWFLLWSSISRNTYSISLHYLNSFIVTIIRSLIWFYVYCYCESVFVYLISQWMLRDNRINLFGAILIVKEKRKKREYYNCIVRN